MVSFIIGNAWLYLFYVTADSLLNCYALDKVIHVAKG